LPEPFEDFALRIAGRFECTDRALSSRSRKQRLAGPPCEIRSRQSEEARLVNATSWHRPRAVRPARTRPAAISYHRKTSDRESTTAVERTRLHLACLRSAPRSSPSSQRRDEPAGHTRSRQETHVPREACGSVMPRATACTQ